MANCKSCGKEIYFLKTLSGKSIPVNGDSLHKNELEAVKNKIEVSFDRTRHVTHFRDCPSAKEFRKK